MPMYAYTYLSIVPLEIVGVLIGEGGEELYEISIGCCK